MDSNNDDLVRVEVRFKNARLYNAIMDDAIPIFGAKSAAGLAARQRGHIKAWCEFHDLPLTHVYELLKFEKWTVR